MVDALYSLDIDTYEADIKPHTRFLIDKDLHGGILIEGDYEDSEKVDRAYNNSEIKPAMSKAALKILSLDTESGKGGLGLYCIGLYSEGYEKTFMITDKKMKNVVSCKTEEECLIKGKNRHVEIDNLYKKDQQKLVDYNMLDCKLAYDILKKTAMVELAIERSELTGLPLDRLGASVAAFDSLYIREARKRGLVSPTTRYAKKEEGIIGGYVKSSKPGIYNNVLVMDFKSLYPSILKTFNIDPASLLEKKEPGAIESPNKAYFKNQEGILPAILEKLHQAREKAKKEKRELSSYAIKIIMNSFFGVLANPNCRYFNFDMANSITHFGQAIIKLTAQKIEEKGYKVIYSDTDSCFIETNLGK